MNQGSLPKKYAAFISYRHLSPDQEIAHTLHKLLEHNLVRPNRNVPRNIRPVFLDTSELPLEEDLDQSILDALDQSECLIVVCSPNLPLSKYCMREISYFKERHGGSLNRVYTILAAGEPSEAFPDLLRTTVKQIQQPDGSFREETIAAEPLFADVRGKTIFHSLWKLYKSEYMRLAAAYYRCSYDQLYKRYLRWIISVAVTAVLGAFAVGIGFHVNSQALLTDTITSHAEQCVADEKELLAMALCAEAEYTVSQRYQTALRNAVVQYDYKEHGEPISAIQLNHFMKDFDSVRYISKEGNRIITKANAMLQITDAKTGEIYLHEPQDRVFVTGDNPETFIKLHSHKDENGTMRDYVSLFSLDDLSVIREFPYRESDRNSASYKLIQAIETDQLLVVSDGKRYVAYMTSDGQQLSEEEFIRLAEAHVNTPLQEDDTPYRISKDKLRNKYAVKDSEGQTLLVLDGVATAFDISDDLQHFAWTDEENIYVYDTGSWEQVAVSSLKGQTVQKLHLLANSTYYLATYLDSGETRCTVRDWRTGRYLLSFTGTPLFSPDETCFFIAENGKIIRYEYQDLDIEKETVVIAHVRDRCLSIGSGRLLLRDTKSGNVIMNVSCSERHEPSYDAALKKILTWHSEGIICYGENGEVLWQIRENVHGCVISEDGSKAAWADAVGNVHVLDGNTGLETECVSAAELTQAGKIDTLAVSGEGLCVGGSDGVLWIPQGTQEPLWLNMHTNVRLSADGYLFLSDDYARVMDFAVWDVSKQDTVYQPDNNTGIWAYSSASDVLVRHVQTSGNNPTMTLEILKRKGNGFSAIGTVTLPSDQVDRLSLDSTGQWISIISGGKSILYRVSDMEKALDAACCVYYEDGILYGERVYGDVQYMIPMYPVKELEKYAQEALSSQTGTRVLTEDERVQYGIQK